MLEERNASWEGVRGVLDYLRDSDGDLIKVVVYLLIFLFVR